MPGQSQTVSLDSPVGGWNAFDSLDNMPPTDAIILDNLVPGAGTVNTRQGVIEYVDLGTGLPCETVANFNSADDSKLLAASGGGMWDITDSEVELEAAALVELAPVGTFTNDRWQTENFRRADETGVLLMCNGADNAQVFNGTGLADLIDTEGVGTDFIGVETFKGRCYYWKDNDDAFYYTDAGSYQGNLARFPLGAFVKRGGKLILVSTWTQKDSGDGRDDFLVFVFSTGEILVYQGDDPGGIGFFEMVGRYLTSEPLSVRGQDLYGADIIIMTKSGYVGLSSVIQEGNTSDVPRFSRKIHAAVVKQTELRSRLFGWDCVLFPKRGLFIFNVPLSDDSYEQHVMNTVTQKWCRFKDINVNCLQIHDERLFGGTNDGRVLALLEGSSDEGRPITFTGLYAFNYFGSPGVNKHLTAAQVISTHSAPELLSLSAFADYELPSISPVEVPAGITLGTWSIPPATPPQTLGSEWDDDFWARSGDERSYKGWQNVSGYGYAVAVLVRFAKLNEGVKWRSTTVRFNTAGAQ